MNNRVDYYTRAQECIISETYLNGRDFSCNVEDEPKDTAELIEDSENRLIICVLITNVGMIATGESFCDNKEYFDMSTGQDIAKERALKKLSYLFAAKDRNTMYE